jgi:hypothetical protein
MELKFVPRGTELVPVVGEKTPHGASPKRICAQVKDNRWVMRAQPHVVDSDSRAGENLVRVCKKGGLAPFDKATADYCGVSFEELTFSGPDTGWVPAQQREVLQRKSKKETE